MLVRARWGYEWQSMISVMVRRDNMWRLSLLLRCETNKSICSGLVPMQWKLLSTGQKCPHRGCNENGIPHTVNKERDANQVMMQLAHHATVII